MSSSIVCFALPGDPASWAVLWRVPGPRERPSPL